MNGATVNQEELPVTIITPPKKWVPVNLTELWAYHELLYIFTWRDVKLRYKQTALGAAWAIIQPLFAMVIFTVIFGGLAKIPSDGVPYPLFSLAALIPWTLFAEGLTRSTLSMVQNQNILTKVYFPRLIMPLSGILSPLVDFCVSSLILALMILYFGFTLTINIIFLPIFIIFALITSLSVGIWLSALNVMYRDFQYTVPFLIQVWLYASPVVYPSSLFPEKWQILYGLNPMAGVIEGFRWSLLGTTPPSAMIWLSFGVVFLLLVAGIFYFRKVEQYYADIV